MSDTPRTDHAYKASAKGGIYELFNESQKLERELNAAKERIKRLEIAGDTLATLTIRNGRSHDQWHEAKEAA